MKKIVTFQKKDLRILPLLILGFQLSACAEERGAVSADEVKLTTTEDHSKSVAVIPDYRGIHTWWHANHEFNDSGPVADENVRRSTVYDVEVASAHKDGKSQRSFVYMSIPRGGSEKIGYSYADGAEFASESKLSMSWSSFLYEKDVWVTVHLKDGQHLSSVEEVRIRPSDLGLEKELIDANSLRIRVPYSETGYRFSVEFDYQLYTSYNDMRGATGQLSENPGGAEIHTEPRNALMIFAEPMPGDAEREEYLSELRQLDVHKPNPGRLDPGTIDGDAIYFEPGIYYQPGNEHLYLPSSVRWVYLEPGAYIKSALQFSGNASEVNIVGFGVLSGENYVYQADRENGYAAREESKNNCHATCVKMLEFSSSENTQALNIHGVTVNQPPYHSFVVYGDEDTFETHISNYKQVGAWYWQTDGVELYRGGSLSDSFFHANDDVLKMYHSDTSAENIVVWKGENGPVIQFGWASRNIDNTHVNGVDIIHNRMYWQDRKHNTCIINSARLYSETPLEKDKVSLANTVRNLTFSNISAEGQNLCAMRLFALSNWENIRVENFEIESWNALTDSSHYSLLEAAYTSGSNPQQVSIAPGYGVVIENYLVEGQPITKDNGYWKADQLGGLKFDEEIWESWGATATVSASCTPQTIDFDSLPRFAAAGSQLALGATTSSELPATFNVAAGDAQLLDSSLLNLGSAGGVSVAAVQVGDAHFCGKRVSAGINVFDPATGPGERWVGASWNGWSPGNLPMQWDAASGRYLVQVQLEAGDHAMKFTDSDNWSGDDWGSATGLAGTAVETTGGGANINFTVSFAGSYLIGFEPVTNRYSIAAE